MRLARRPVDEEALVGPVLAQEVFGEAVIHLIAFLGDAGADRRRDPLDPRAQRQHCRNRPVGHALHRTTPSGMGGADDAGFHIGQQHRRAIGGDHRQQDARPVGH